METANLSLSKEGEGRISNVEGQFVFPYREILEMHEYIIPSNKSLCDCVHLFAGETKCSVE